MRNREECIDSVHDLFYYYDVYSAGGLCKCLADIRIMEPDASDSDGRLWGVTCPYCLRPDVHVLWKGLHRCLECRNLILVGAMNMICAPAMQNKVVVPQVVQEIERENAQKRQREVEQFEEQMERASKQARSDDAVETAQAAEQARAALKGNEQACVLPPIPENRCSSAYTPSASESWSLLRPLSLMRAMGSMTTRLAIRQRRMLLRGFSEVA